MNANFWNLQNCRTVQDTKPQMIFSFFALMLPVLASALVTPSPNMKTLRLHHRRLIQLQNLKCKFTKLITKLIGSSIHQCEIN